MKWTVTPKEVAGYNTMNLFVLPGPGSNTRALFVSLKVTDRMQFPCCCGTCGDKGVGKRVDEHGRGGASFGAIGILLAYPI